MDEQFPFGKLPHDDVTPEAYNRAVEGLEEVLSLNLNNIENFEDFITHLELFPKDLFSILKSNGSIETLDISSERLPTAEFSEYIILLRHDGHEETKIWSSGTNIFASRINRKSHEIVYSWAIPVDPFDIVSKMSYNSVVHTKTSTKQYNPFMKEAKETWQGYISIVKLTLNELFDSGILDK